PNRDDGEQRGVFSAQVSLPDSLGGGTCRLLATHLDHRSSDVERLASIRMIRRLIADNTTPTILGGDFNATIDSDVMNQVRRDWTLSNQTERPTFPASHPDRQIDYIGFRPADRFQVRQVQVLDEAVASDHRPILLLLTPVGH
ncbi:MAG: endonuclease/exonuclease/phosphatase family protein, partial [Blastopirellula sp. JB062]